MVGTLLCTRAAMQVMQKQTSGGHIFNMDGAGADGMPTPQYAAYGATKAGSAPPLPFVVCDASSASLLRYVVMHGTVLLMPADLAQQHQCMELMRNCWLEPFVEKGITRSI